MLLLAGIHLADFTRNSFTRLSDLQILAERNDSVQKAGDIMRKQEVMLVSLRTASEKYRNENPARDFALYLEQHCSEANVKITALPGQSQIGESVSGKVMEKFQLQGEFFDMLQVLFDMEIQDHIAQIEHLRWRRQKVMVNGKMIYYLVADVVVER